QGAGDLVVRAAFAQAQQDFFFAGRQAGPVLGLIAGGRSPNQALEILSGLHEDTLAIAWPLNPGAAEPSEQIRRGRPPQEVAVSHAGVRDENVITGFVNTEGEGRQIWRGDLAF